MSEPCKPNNDIRIAVVGAAGRMGGALIRAIHADSQLQLGCALEHAQSKSLTQDAGALAGVGKLDCPIIEQADGQHFDVMIDFSTPTTTINNIAFCEKSGNAIVIGTTGMDDEMMLQMQQAAKTIPILFSANYSVGINVLIKCLKMATAAMGEQSDIEIIEAHHRHKVDAPSGTALMLGEAIAGQMGTTVTKRGVFTRHGQIGERENNTIGFSTIRGGDIAGEHHVIFIGESERLELGHRATDRKIFAAGALRAAKWLSSQPVGLYDMDHVLNL